MDVEDDQKNPDPVIVVKGGMNLFSKLTKNFESSLFCIPAYIFPFPEM